MTRTILATAAALFAATTLLASAAEACISCEYTPEVVRENSKSHATSRAYATREIVARPAKKRIAVTQPVARKVETPKSETTKSAATETKSESGSTTVASASPVDSEPVAVAETEVAADVGCKKFVSAIGATITVPCQ